MSGFGESASTLLPGAPRDQPGGPGTVFLTQRWDRLGVAIADPPAIRTAVVAAIEDRLASLSDPELASLSQRMQDIPAGGDGLLVVIGLTFVVLIILELVGVIDIFKRT